MLDWYWPAVKGAPASPEVRAEFASLWRPVIDRLLALPGGWFLRDYHSPNILWLPERKGVARVGIIDFQDALNEHPAFDLVSLLQDARVTVPPSLEAELIAHYCAEAAAQDAGFDRDAFMTRMRISVRSGTLVSSGFGCGCSSATESLTICSICRALGDIWTGISASRILQRSRHGTTSLPAGIAARGCAGRPTTVMTSRIDTAMVLAAGLGTRMAPASGTLPKPLVQLDGKTLLDRVLDKLAAAGIARAVVNVHHKADQIEARLDGRKAPKIVISNEREKLLDTGGGVKKALPLLGCGAFHRAQFGFGLDRRHRLEPQAPRRGLGRCAHGLPDAAGARKFSYGYQGRGDFAFDSDGRIRRRKIEQESYPSHSQAYPSRIRASLQMPPTAYSR